MLKNDALHRPTRRRFGSTFLVAAGLTLAVGSSLTFIPVPYVVESPGPTVDVGGRLGSNAILEIGGTDPDTGQSVQVDPLHDGESTGELRLVTVSEAGGPGRRLNAVELAYHWFDEASEIHRYDDVYGPEDTKETIQERGQAQMTGAQSAATVAALEELGWEVPATVTVHQALPGTGSDGKLAEGDVMVSLTTPDGTVHPVNSAAVPFRVMRTVEPNSTVKVAITRGDEQLTVDIVTTGVEGEEGSKLGVLLSADVQLPLDVSIELENILGPSAGMIFALGIIDRLTPGDMTGGQVIAGTGTVNYDGAVGSIGGVRQKMWGAKRDGATWFLAPQANCADIVGNKPEGLRVVAVSSLSQARAAVDAIAAGEGDALPTCTDTTGLATSQ